MNTPVGTAAATDADAGQTLAYAITGGNTNNAFAIDANGQITVNNAVLDYEAQSTYTLTIDATDNDTPAQTDSATITINLIDVQTFVSINDATLSEFNNGTWAYNFTVTSSAAINQPFSLGADTIDGTATAGSDYAAVSNARLDFWGGGAGETHQLTVWVNGDTAAERDEVFFVLLNGGGNDVTLIDPVGLGTVLNDDVATFTIDDVSANESAGTMTFTVSLSAPLDSPATVNVTFANNTTSAGDFTQTTLQVSFPANSVTPQTVTVTGIDDLFAELDETFTASLALSGSTPLPGFSVDATDTATGTIVDNDTTVTLASIAEDVTNSAGATVSTILGPSLPGKGMAVVAVDNTGGAWQYSINGGTSWTNLSAGTGRVNLALTARLLSSANKVRFVPGSSYNGTVSFVYRVWDLTGGAAGTTVDLSNPASYGGSTAYSGATSSARLTVTPANDAPELLFGNPFMTPVAVGNTNPAGDTVSAIAGHMYSDRDGNPMGVAVTYLTGTASGTWQYSLDGGTSWQGMGTVSNSSALALSGTDRVRFVPKGSFSGSASFYFRAWDGSNGVEHGSRTQITANGQKTPFSWITKTATVQVTNNTAPTLAAGTSALTDINEGVTNAANVGNTVSSVVGVSITDADSGALRGIAVTSIDNTNGRWQYSTNNGVTWFDFTSAQGVVDMSAAAQTLSDVNKVRFVPNANYAGSSSFSYRGWDRTFGTVGWDADVRQGLAAGGRTSFSTGARTATINVIGVNDAPVLAAGTPALTQATGFNPSAPGDTVASFASEFISDADSGAVKGIAVTGKTGEGANGTWEYSTDGGSTWAAIGTVSSSSALLLRETDRIRFQPTGSAYIGTATISYRAWDQTGTTFGMQGQKVSPTPTGGINPFSTGTQTASMLSYNDAPVLAQGNPVLPSVTTGTPAPVGQTVASFAGAFITDPDSSSVTVLKGIAVMGLTGTNGVWEYSLDGGTNYLAIGPVSWTSARLLGESALVRFRPTVTTWVGSATMNYRAWDQTGTTAGGEGTRVTTAKTGGKTPFSTGTQTVSVRSNNAPVLAFGGPALAPVNGNSPTPAWQAVSSFANTSISDLDSGALKGVAVTDVSGANGTWQYSTDGGTTINSIGPVSYTSALLLRDTDLVRFLPNTALYNGAASITYRAWDQSGTTAGLQGTKVSTANNGDFYAFSMASQSATTRSNQSPNLFFGEPRLNSVTAPAPLGQTVASFANAFITDLDAGALKGIAVTGVTGLNGAWEYSTTGGSSWVAVPAVTPGSSLLLRDTDLVRFNPTVATFTGSATITYRAWDRTSGLAGDSVPTTTNGNPTPFSTATQTATVRSNNAPVLRTGNVSLTKVSSTSPAGQSVASFATGAISDADVGDLKGIAVTGVVGYDGVWEYSTDAGVTYQAMGAISGSQSLLLRDTDFVRFRPTTAAYNSTTPTITYRAWDRSSGSSGLFGTKVSTDVSGDYTPFSSGLETAVVRGNNAPVLSTAGVTLTKITSITPLGQTVSSFANAAITDSDAGDQKGIAVTGVTGTGGAWEYSTDGGVSYQAVGTVDATQSLLLRDTDLVRFKPSSGTFSGTATITYCAWDRTAGVQGQKVATGTNGNYTPFSTAQATATVKSNVAPVLSTATVNMTAVTTGTPPGQTVGSFANAGITESDPEDLKGIAITGLNGLGSNGFWEYSINGGTTWLAVGTVDATQSLLLRDTDLIRFHPTVTGFTGTASITYRAWDRSGATSGLQGQKVGTGTNGNFTPFSSAQATANVSVTV